MDVRDYYDRRIDYLRISVTDRCNFRCVYCMPPEGLVQVDHADILTYEEILRIVRIVATCGIRRVRLTGGEPLIRKDIVKLVRHIRELGVIEDLSLTTNGSLLAPIARELKEAGLDRVNISLDTLQAANFTRITGGYGNLEEVLAGLRAALAAGLTPVKVNVVLTELLTEKDLEGFLELIYQYPIAVRFIEFMPIGYGGIGPGYTPEEARELLRCKAGTLEPLERFGRGNGPAVYTRPTNAVGAFGFITPLSQHFCGTCNRVRLTADGKFRACLLSEQEQDIMSILRDGGSDQDIARVFAKMLRSKPDGHHVENYQEQNFARRMSQIGG